MDSKYTELLRIAYDRYLNLHDKLSLHPNQKVLNYDFDFINNRKWHVMGDTLVEHELTELTNLLNRWGFSLQSWQVWNKVLDEYDEDAAWIVQYEFVEALVHECLLRPSSIRDTFTSVATKSFHQVRLGSEDGYRDYLYGDPTQPNEKAKRLKRKEKEKRLKDICRPWPEAHKFIRALCKLNDSTYQEMTFDYRNLTSHTIGPRLGIGDTQIVTRTVQQAEEMKDQGDGRYLLEPVPGKMSVGYGLGGTSPLNLKEVYSYNLEQFEMALTCYSGYRHVLQHSISEIEMVETQNS